MSTTTPFGSPAATPRRPPRPTKAPSLSHKTTLMKKSTITTEIDYPLGKNPFGDDESDNDTFESGPVTYPEIKVEKEEPTEEKHKKVEPTLKNVILTDNEQLNTINSEKSEPNSANVTNSQPPHFSMTSKNPFDSESEDSHSDHHFLNVRLSVPPEVPVRTFKKRAAPKPPAASTTVSMEILPTEPTSNSRDSSSIRGGNINSSDTNDSDNQASSMNQASKLSNSCGNGLHENHRTRGPKKLAPPQPVPEKREVRTDGSSDFVDYPVLRREIEEVVNHLSSVQADIAVMQTKISSTETDLAKHKKYTKKMEKLTQKHRSLAQKQNELTNRLQKQTLEDRHADLEHELRNILAKQEHLRTPEEKAREEECLKLLVEIVEQRAQLAEDQSSLCDPDDEFAESNIGTLHSAIKLLRKPLKITHFTGKSDKEKSETILPNPVS